MRKVHVRVGLLRGTEIAIAFYISNSGRADKLTALKSTQVFLQAPGVASFVFSIDFRKHRQEPGEFVACDTGVASNRHAFGQLDRGVKVLEQARGIVGNVPKNVCLFAGQIGFWRS